MPIYEYICHACGDEFEAIQKFSDNPLTQCQCGKKGKVERKLSLSAFQLKGGGWYAQGYNGGANGSGGNGSSASASSESKSGGASDGGASSSSGPSVSS